MKSLNIVLALVSLLLLMATSVSAQEASGSEGSSAAAQPAAPSEVGQGPEAVPLLPRSLLFGNPDKARARLSYDGTRIGFLAPVNGVMNVWVGPASDPSAARPVTNDTDRGIDRYDWSYNSNYLVYLQDQAGDENWRVYGLDLDSGKVSDLTPQKGVQARIETLSPRFPNELMVSINDRDPQYHDLYRVNLQTGQRSLVLKNDGFSSFVLDDDFQVRFASRSTPDGGEEYLTPTQDGSWKSFMKVPMEDSLTTDIVGFDKTGNLAYILDSRGRNTAALYSMDPATGQETLLAENPDADLSDVLVKPSDETVQAVAFTYERKEWQLLDNSVADDLAYLKTVADGDVEIVSRTLDDSYWMVAYLMDNGPVRYYRYDRKAHQAQFLFTQRKDLENQPLAKMHPVTIDSRDGLKLVSYYTLPLGSDAKQEGRPDQPLPMVLYVHGGPWARDEWGFDPVHQWLANRGYAVLSVNYRGSTGFGKDFINASNLEWGGKMHDDLIDAVDWAVRERIAMPDKVAIMGGSYGGYATLWGMTNTPDRFACGVDIVGPSNLLTLLASIPPYWQPEIELFAKRVGDPRTEEGRALLAARSPLNYVDRIQHPLLIGQGVNDPRVKQAESDQIVQAMRQAGVPVTYLLYPDEGHGFARPENNLSFYAVEESFLAQQIGGRVEPMGSFQGSSITVPWGADAVPGLAETMAAQTAGQ